MKTRVIQRLFYGDERGLETIEYAIMTALIVGVLAIAVALLSVAIAGSFNDLAVVIGP